MTSRMTLCRALVGSAVAAATLLVGPSVGATSATSSPATSSPATSSPATSSPATAFAEAGSRRGPLRYVAMGDSYSAASGVLPRDRSAAFECARSTRNYPHVIAEEIGASLTDVTCGGAATQDYFEPQYRGVPPQLEALSRRTQLVTMTIGGNDDGVFINAIARCGAAGAAALYQGTPCKDRFGESFVGTVRNRTYPALVRALEAVHRRAPRATVAIIGYPWILPRTTGCFDKIPVAPGDVPYLRHLQATLNDAVRRAAAATGSRYVNLNKVSDGHDACQRIGVRWVEPVLQGTNPVVVHPNALGEARMAARVIRVLDLR